VVRLMTAPRVTVVPGIGVGCGHAQCSESSDPFDLGRQNRYGHMKSDLECHMCHRMCYRCVKKIVAHVLLFCGTRGVEAGTADKQLSKRKLAIFRSHNSTLSLTYPIQ